MTTVTLLADPDIDLDKLMLEGIDTSAGPIFSVSELSRFFFARSPHWVRWLEQCHYTEPKKNPKTGRMKNEQCKIPISAHSKKLREAHQHTWKFVFDGEMLTPRRNGSGAREYDLTLIEKIAHALAANGTIKVSQLRHALQLVRIQAEMHEYL